MAHAQIGRQLSSRPVCAAVRRFLLYPPRDASLNGRGRGSRLTSLVSWLQTLYSTFFKAGFPQRNCLFRGPQGDSDPRPCPAIGKRKDQPCPEHVARGQRARLRPSRKLIPLNVSDLQQIPIASRDSAFQPTTPRAWKDYW